MPRKPKLWSGKRFANCVKKVSKRYGKDSAKRICAAAWIKKYWKKKMMELAKKWRK